MRAYQHRLHQTIAVNLYVENNPNLIKDHPALIENNPALIENNPALIEKIIQPQQNIIPPQFSDDSNANMASTEYLSPSNTTYFNQGETLFFFFFYSSQIGFRTYF